MRRVRVLAIGNMYPPHHLGGYELAWFSAVSHLRAQGHQVRVLTTDFLTSSADADEPETFRELRWYWSDHGWPRTSLPERIALERHNGEVLERHLREQRPELVTWWAMGGMSLALIERVRRGGLPALAFVHDDWLIYGPEVDQWVRPFRGRPALAAAAERVTRLPSRIRLAKAARYLFVSETVRGHARAAGYELPASGILHSGVDDAFLDPRPVRPWTWRLLYVGRLDERKGVLDAVSALSHLPEEATLTIAGAGDRAVADQLLGQAKRLGVDPRVSVLGMCHRESLPDLYASADAVLFPVRWEEPWGLVPLEAMGIGRPVLATGRGGSADYLRNGVNSVSVPPGDPGAIALAVRRLAEDPDLRELLRQGGFETARRYTDAAWREGVLAAVETAVPSGDVAAHDAP